MYINSDFIDYYDFCTKYGQDPKIVYNRKTSTVPTIDKKKLGYSPLDSADPSQFLKLCSNVVRELNPSSVYTKNTGWSSSYPISFYCVGGHPYFLIHETHTVASFMEAWNYKNDKQQQRGGWFSPYSTGKNFEALCKQEKLIQLHAHLGVPLFGLNYNSGFGGKWILNPCLKEVKFPVDPMVVYTAIFNSLQSPEPKLVQVDDKYKALAHGMDSCSFKREPGGPTRKRKKSQLGMI